VLLVVDVPQDVREWRLSEEYWFDSAAKRYMIWGAFDDIITHVYPAKELRAQVRQKGVAGETDEYKATVLRQYIDRTLASCPSLLPWPPVAEPKKPPTARRQAKPRPTTSTMTPDNQLVPWLAASVSLAYSPQNPPERDYYFQYGWILPAILADHVNKRRHWWFGATHKHHTSELFRFWNAARQGAVSEVICRIGEVSHDLVRAPVAVYATTVHACELGYLLMQHASYQFVRADQQPLISSGEVLLYRGVEKAERFCWPRIGPLDEKHRDIWCRYVEAQAHILSDSVRSFNSIHDRAVRCETGHLRDHTRMSDDIGRQQGLDLEGDEFTSSLWAATHQSFALERSVAKYKFGPNFIVAKTPLTNIRMTTFFAGEYEVRVIDPDQVEFIEQHGCTVVTNNQRQYGTAR
jgi:hypothetical protein